MSRLFRRSPAVVRPRDVVRVGPDEALVVFLEPGLSAEACARVKREWERLYPQTPLAVFSGATGAATIPRPSWWEQS